MAESLTAARLTLLAQLLDLPAESLSGLGRLRPAEIAALTRRLSDELFDALAPTFAKVSKLAPLMPDQLVVSVAQKVVPAMVAGRAAGAIGMAHPERAAGVLARCRPDYLADAAAYLDPRVIPVLAPRVTVDVLLPAAEELLRRGEYALAAQFLEHAPDELVLGFVQAIDDDTALLRTTAMILSDQRLRELFPLVPQMRRNRIAEHAATADTSTVLAALSVLTRLDDAVAAPLACAMLGSCDDATAHRLVTIAADAGAMPELLALSDHVDDATLNRFAQHEQFIHHSLSRTRVTSG
ncbi:hypothetical protein ACIBCD_15525 [Nocardia brasiliensis]|uniref:hypothetical protein n=1 Tax=Nocardia brasiliensis TaxID=37326 RepID=UPI0037B73404